MIKRLNRIMYVIRQFVRDCTELKDCWKAFQQKKNAALQIVMLDESNIRTCNVDWASVREAYNDFWSAYNRMQIKGGLCTLYAELFYGYTKIVT